MKIGIVGGTGNISQPIVRLLLEKGHEVMIIGRDTGADKVVLDPLMVNGVRNNKANRGDKITFYFERKIRTQDKLYKVVSENA